MKMYTKGTSSFNKTSYTKLKLESLRYAPFYVILSTLLIVLYLLKIEEHRKSFTSAPLENLLWLLFLLFN